MRSVAPYDRRDIFGSFHLVKSPNKVLMLINEKEVNMLYDDLYLAHHGVKGMRWGVRRYQNENGSLTNAGKRRYLKSNGITLKGNAGKLYKKDPRAISNYSSYIGKKTIASRLNDDDISSLRKKYRAMRDHNEKYTSTMDKHYEHALSKLKKGEWKSDIDIDDYAWSKARKELGNDFINTNKRLNDDYNNSVHSLLMSKLGEDVFNTPLIESSTGSNRLTVGRSAAGALISALSTEYNDERRNNRG